MAKGTIRFSKMFLDLCRPDMLAVIDTFKSQAISCDMTIDPRSGAYEYHLDHPDFVDVEHPEATRYVLNFQRSRDHGMILQSLGLHYEHQYRVVREYEPPHPAHSWRPVRL